MSFHYTYLKVNPLIFILNKEIRMLKLSKILLGSLLFFTFGFAYGNPLSEAADIQAAAHQQKQNQENIESTKINIKNELNDILQFLFYQYYKKVESSEISLANAQDEVNKLNETRRLSGQCCDIYILEHKDNGRYLIDTDKSGIFAIEGYGLQYVYGEIHDPNFEQTGTLSPQCIYEVTISYNNSRKYDCSQFLGRGLDNKIIDDMLEMLPIAMKNYFR